MKSLPEIESILIKKIQEETGLSEDEIDLDTPFQHLGVDSQAIISISGDLEDIFSIRLEPTALFEFPTLRLMSEHLVKIQGEKKQLAKSKLKFSLFFFSYGPSDLGTYDLIMRASEFADKNGFEAIWLPERHFHEMGGATPNSAVLASAIAVKTKSIKLRAGSVVLPLHDPIRVVEEWSMVDQLSQGRVELSFASGWHVNDFIFFPDRYKDRKNYLFDNVKNIQDLWTSGRIKRKNGDGQLAEVTLHPRPVQRRVPTWITAIGNPETYVKAAEVESHLLTCLLDQGMDQLESKITSYREKLKLLGSADKKAALFLHTYVGESKAATRNLVEKPFKHYLKGTLDLLKQFEHNASVGIDIASMSELHKEELLQFAFERYLEDRSLMGEIDHCESIARKLQNKGIDELACIIDFGLPSEEVMSGLKRLNELKNRFS